MIDRPKRFHHYELVIEVAKAINAGQQTEWQVTWENMSGISHEHYFKQARTVLARLDELGLAVVDKEWFEERYGPQWVLSKKDWRNLDAPSPGSSEHEAVNDSPSDVGAND